MAAKCNKDYDIIMDSILMGVCLVFLETRTFYCWLLGKYLWSILIVIQEAQ